jgi:Family of unknown function (DUF5719)
VKAVHLVPVGVVVLVAAAIGGAAQLDHPAAGAKPVAAVTRQVTVTSVARACPPALNGGSGTVALLANPTNPTSPAASATPASATPASATPASGAASGQAELTPLPPAGLPLRPASAVSATRPGALTLLTVPAAVSTANKGVAAATGWSVGAAGPMAQALEAEVAESSGLATVRCGEPSSDLWFVGPGQQNGAARIQLDLMNIDSLAATVAISLITDAGPVQGGNITGITVPPHQTVTESLSSAAANSSVVAIGVHTSVGRVAADVSAGPVHGNPTSWLPSAAAPATQQVIPGVHPSGQAAGLYLVVPGSANAKVNVLAITPQGHYRPFGTQPIELPGESASYVALTPLGGTPAALQITANVPVTASVMVPGSGVGAFTTATGPISEQAVVAGNTSGSGLAASVVLSAPAAAARVRLTEIGSASSSASSSAGAASNTTSASQVLTVQAGHTLLAPVTPPPGAKRGTPFALVITPLAGSGPLYAARIETQNQSTVVSIIPAVSALTTISLPPVSDSYTALSP